MKAILAMLAATLVHASVHAAPPVIGGYCTQAEAEALADTTIVVQRWEHWSMNTDDGVDGMRDPRTVTRAYYVDLDLRVFEVDMGDKFTIRPKGDRRKITELAAVDPANAIPGDCQWNWWFPVGENAAQSVNFRTSPGEVYLDKPCGPGCSWNDTTYHRTKHWYGEGWLYINGQPQDVQLFNARMVDDPYPPGLLDE